MRTLVGLAGPAHVGKDTVGAALGFKRLAFADALKAELQPLLSSLGLDIRDPQHKEWARQLMVAYGTLARQMSPDYWVRKVEAALPPDGDVVITDVRYTNEARFILGRGGFLFFLCRTGVTPANDEESRSLQELQHSVYLDPRFFYLNNDGTPAEAAAMIRRVVADAGKVEA